MRKIYTFILYLALPAIFLRLLWRSRKQPAYRSRMRERFGLGGKMVDRACIWMHAVSVGETMAAQQIIERIKAKYPEKRILVTTMTPTGAATVSRLFGDTVTHRYLPYDLPFALRRFFTEEKPEMGIIMETELWPNLIHQAKCRNLPLFLLNARLSARSARGYARFPALTRAMVQGFVSIAVQSEVEKERFLALGAIPEKVQVTGSVKFDLSVPLDLIERANKQKRLLGDRSFIWIAASTHQGEETIALHAHQALLKICPDALLILVPRHPDRFQAAYAESTVACLTARRSANETVTPETAVYLVDTMGELSLFYAVADLAFVGGSLVNTGGHNLLEPAVLAKPILAGPHLFNFAAVATVLQHAGGMMLVNEETFPNILIDLYRNLHHREDMGLAAKKVLEANRGATEKQLALIFA